MKSMPSFTIAAVIITSIVFSLPHVLSNLRDSTAPQAIFSLQLLALAYLSGLWKLPNVPANFAAEYAEPLHAAHVVWNRVGTYFKVGLLLLLACYMPIYYGLPLAFQPWLHGLIVFAVTVVGYFAPTAKFVGPARFGYLHHADHLSRIFRWLLGWWGYAALVLVFLPVVLPSAGLGLAALSLAFCVHVYRATRPWHPWPRRRDAAAAGRYEAQLAAAASTARRDALQALRVRPSDFFDSAAEAWAALGAVTQSAEDAAERAQNLLDAANEAAGSEKPDEEAGRTELLGQYLAESAQTTLEEAQGVVSKLRTAQEAISRSQNAAAEDQKARAAADQNAAAATQAVKRLAEVVKAWPGMAFSAATAAASTRAFADRALAAATEGEMAQAWELAASAEASANDAKMWMERLRADVGNGQQALLSWLEGNA
ncbi:hypothetical protein SPI_09314 [Niveomyces insectorum RCEF 264]|uniref:Uncharacterized protein n=1 Tax=Niveomyces insectorum RCEF 264 TaxID=1081102 RepID=A0A167LWN4_9HYPO|nr:hypothetical protein SPI_09314 [Niveomyces insectorum RCEF 264]